MLNEEKKQFHDLMQSVMAVYGREFNGAIMAIWWAALKDYDFKTVSMAMSAHTKSSEFAPTPASVLKHLPDTSGWLSANEAWAVLPKTEYDGGYVNNEIMAGMAACGDLLDRNDLIAARMAFIPAYERAVTASKAEGRQPHWFYSAPSQGDYETKLDIKEAALLLAQEKKWITSSVCNDAMKQLGRTAQPTGQMIELLEKCRIGIGSDATETE